MNTAITFLFFHYGKLPQYLHNAIEQVRVFNPEAEILLITEDVEEVPELGPFNIVHRRTAEFGSPELDLFKERYRHISCFKEKYERFVLERWFMTETIRRQRPDRTYIMQDSDVAVFGDASNLLPLLPDCPIAMSGPNPHFTFIRGSIDEFLQFILDYYADEERLAAAQRLFEARRNSDNIYNLGEMTLLFEFLEKSSSMQMFETDTPHGYIDTCPRPSTSCSSADGRAKKCGGRPRAAALFRTFSKTANPSAPSLCTFKVPENACFTGSTGSVGRLGVFLSGGSTRCIRTKRWPA